MTGLPVTPRAVAFGIPPRLRALMLEHLPNVLMLDDPLEVMAAVSDGPAVNLIYGELAFGAAVTGHPPRFLAEQANNRTISRVWVLIDAPPMGLRELEWDDPRQLVIHAAHTLCAGRFVDVSQPGAWVALDVALDAPVDTPPSEGVDSPSDGND